MELTAAEPRRRGLTQLFIDGEPAVRVDTETFTLSGYRPGDELTDEALHDLIEASDARRAREKALYLLEHRSHSQKELKEKLMRDGISRDAAEAAVGRLCEVGLVSDEAFARSYARELFLRKRFGARRVRQELRQKGIDRDLIEELIGEFSEEAESGEMIRTLLMRKYPLWREDEKVRRRAFGALQRMGYAYEDIRRVMAEGDDFPEEP